jgi:hypothetical protein
VRHGPAQREVRVGGENIVLTTRVRDRLGENDRDRLEIGTYDDTVRFNLTIIDNTLCVAQPYLPQSRGVDSPTLIVQRRSPTAGLFPMFDQIFNAMWERRRQV